MGLKRKASYLEELPVSPDAGFRHSATPSLTSSPGSLASTTTSDLSPYNSNEHQRSWNSIGGRSYLNSRTRKRFRDGRPSEQTIHQNTLRKLFDGQKLQRQEEDMGCITDDGNGFDDSISADDLGGQTISLLEAPMDRNQRSIESFFGSKGGARSQALPNRGCVDSIPPMVLKCEDCSAPLMSRSIEHGETLMAMDVEGTMAADFQNSWMCMSCARRVCDTCAVMGGYRVCLECAVPGCGTFGSRTIAHDKRWVGGVGWM